MKGFYPLKIAAAAFFVVLVFGVAGHAQCHEETNKATREKVHFHEIRLGSKGEYLRLLSSGEERIFSYYNEKLDLVYHVQMFTEIRFTSPKGNFSLFTTTSDRTRWHTNFILSSPLTARELDKMRGVVKMEILLPEDKKTFVFDMQKNKSFNEAITCVNRNQM